MGTTMDIVLQAGNSAFIAHVGDGRIFLVRGGEILGDRHPRGPAAASGLEADDLSGRNVITRRWGSSQRAC